MKRLHLLVSGCVQGVGFRYHARKKAQDLSIAGWIRNLPDGRVELIIQGEESALKTMIDWCRKGPDRGFVTALEVEELPIDPTLSGFKVY